MKVPFPFDRSYGRLGGRSAFSRSVVRRFFTIGLLLFLVFPLPAQDMLEVLVGYLGLGGSGNVPGWGSMIAAGQERLWRGVWWELGTAGFLMFIMILALNLLGDSLRDALDPRSS